VLSSTATAAIVLTKVLPLGSRPLLWHCAGPAVAAGLGSRRPHRMVRPRHVSRLLWSYATQVTRSALRLLSSYATQAKRIQQCTH
jgi:hypothetical protein